MGIFLFGYVNNYTYLYFMKKLETLRSEIIDEIINKYNTLPKLENNLGFVIFEEYGAYIFGINRRAVDAVIIGVNYNEEHGLLFYNQINCKRDNYNTIKELFNDNVLLSEDDVSYDTLYKVYEILKDI